MRHFAGIFLAPLLLCVVAVGCGNDSKPLSRLDQFKKDQRATVTPNGAVNVETAREAPDGKVEYQTGDGSTWKVDVLPQPDGRSDYGTPVEVKKSP